MKKYVPFLEGSYWGTFTGTPCNMNWFESAEGYAVQYSTARNCRETAKSYNTPEEAKERAEELAETFGKNLYSIHECSFFEYDDEEE